MSKDKRLAAAIKESLYSHERNITLFNKKIMANIYPVVDKDITLEVLPIQSSLNDIMTWRLLYYVNKACSYIINRDILQHKTQERCPVIKL